MNNLNPDSIIKQAFWPQTALEWIELILKSLLVIGSIGAVYQYFDLKQEDRVKQTMEQLQVFNSKPILEARLTLAKVWEPYQATFQQLNQQTVTNEQDKQQILSKIVIPIIQQKTLRREINLLVDFFDNLDICVQHHLCDGPVAQAFFQGYAQSFYHLHQPWIAEQRQSIPNYACHFEAFINPQQRDCRW